MEGQSELCFAKDCEEYGPDTTSLEGMFTDLSDLNNERPAAAALRVTAPGLLDMIDCSKEKRHTTEITSCYFAKCWAVLR